MKVCKVDGRCQRSRSTYSDCKQMPVQSLIFLGQRTPCVQVFTRAWKYNDYGTALWTKGLSENHSCSYFGPILLRVADFTTTSWVAPARTQKVLTSLLTPITAHKKYICPFQITIDHHYSEHHYSHPSTIPTRYSQTHNMPAPSLAQTARKLVLLKHYPLVDGMSSTLIHQREQSHV